MPTKQVHDNGFETTPIRERQARRMSLATQASIEKFENEFVRRKNSCHRREELEVGLLRGKHVSAVRFVSSFFQVLEKLNDAGVDLIFAVGENETIAFSVVITATGEPI